MTTKADVQEWINRAENNVTHIIVVCDTFDHSDYPVYVKQGQNLEEVKAAYNYQNMQRIMEVIEMKPKPKKVYNALVLESKIEKQLRKELQDQLKQTNDQLDALNNPVKYQVRIVSLWITEGEDGIGKGDGQTIQQAVERAERDFVIQNSRMITDIQAEYSLYIVGANKEPLWVADADKMINKHKAVNNKSRLKDKYSFKGD